MATHPTRHAHNGRQPRKVLRVGAHDLPLRQALRLHREKASAEAAQCHFVSLAEARQGLAESRISGTIAPFGNIAIVGAGMAGLHAAMQIQTSSVNAKITFFEASSEEGGRLYSHHFRADPSVYCEIGGMRLPDRQTHPSLHNLLDFLQLKPNREVLERAGLTVEEIPYQLSDKNGNGRVFVNGVRAGPTNGSPILTSTQADKLAKAQGAAALGFSGNIPNNGKTAGEMLDSVMQPYVDTLVQAASKSQEELVKVFLQLANGTPGKPGLDQYSLAQYLKFVEGWGDDQIAYVETMTDQSNAFKVSFMEQLIDFYEFSSQKWTTIKGGLQRLPMACRYLLQQDPNVAFQFNVRVTQVEELPGGKQVRLWGATTPQTGDKRGGNQGNRPLGGDGGESVKAQALGDFDRVLLALPPYAVRLLRVPDTWSQLKREALRAMRYDPIRKIGLLFKTRWWETLQTNPIQGGQTVTDLPSRWIVYPSNDIGSSGKGALLCYSWTNDAYVHLTMTHAEKVEQALQDVEAVHGPVVRQEFLEAFPFEWSLSYAGGIAFFAPGQWSRYYSAMWMPEGRVYFAGEHLSVHHAWVEGALESAHQAVSQMYLDHVEASAHEPHSRVAPSSLMPQGQVEAVLRDDPLEVPDRAVAAV